MIEYIWILFSMNEIGANESTIHTLDKNEIMAKMNVLPGP